MTRKLRLAILTTICLGAALPVASLRAAVRMPIGFYDDPSFRWSSAANVNLAAAHAAHASIIHTLVNWAEVAPTRPHHPLNGNDPAYHLSDLDALVNGAERYDLQVLLTITGSPPWANGGQTQNHPPTNLKDLTQFAQMLASRYNGTHSAYGVVNRFSVWNEPNLGLFLTPQYRGGHIVSAAIYARLFMAAYRGIKAGNPAALVAAGETSNRGHGEPTGSGGQDSVAPGTFARLLARVAPHLPFAAWATHPYPSNFAFGPTQKVRFPDVSFSTLGEFSSALARWFHRPVPIWVTEYGEETKPQYPYGVSYAQQAADVRTALRMAARDPDVQMFVWFIFRDSSAGTWFSGLEQANGRNKPALAAFSRAAAHIVGQSQHVRPGRPFVVRLAVPFMLYHDPPGTGVGITYTIERARTTVASGQPREALERDESLSFPVAFSPARGLSYTMVVVVNDRHGQIERHVITLLPVAKRSLALVARARHAHLARGG